MLTAGKMFLKFPFLFNWIKGLSYEGLSIWFQYNVLLLGVGSWNIRGEPGLDRLNFASFTSISGRSKFLPSVISFEIQKAVWDLQIPGCKTRVDKDQIREVVLAGIILRLNLMENFSTCLLNASMETGALTLNTKQGWSLIPGPHQMAVLFIFLFRRK